VLTFHYEKSLMLVAIFPEIRTNLAEKSKKSALFVYFNKFIVLFDRFLLSLQMKPI